MEEYCLHNTLQSSQELRIWLWAIGGTRFSTTMGNEQLHCWGSLLFPCSAHSPGLTLLLSVAFMELQTMTGIRWCHPLDTLKLLAFWSPISFAVEMSHFSSLRKTWQSYMFSALLPSCQVFSVLCGEAPGQIFVSE